MAQFYSAKKHKPKTNQLKAQAANPKTARVIIERLDAFGQGIAKLDGKTVFVANALPTEEVEISLIEEKRQYAKATVRQRFNDSPDRVKPVCPHFGVCGGCQQQHIKPELQRQSKFDTLQRLLTKKSAIQVNSSQIIFDEPYHYRRRARFGLQYHLKQQRLVMGFRQAASNQLVEVTCCPVMRQEIEHLIQPLRACLSGLESIEQLGHVELAVTDSGRLIVLRHLSQLSATDRQTLLTFAKQHELSFFVAFNDGEVALIYGNEPYYTIEALTLSFNPQGFIQVNENINRKMVNQALQWLDIKAEDRILDLFCGVGNFTLPIAKQAQRVIGVEGVSSLVALGQQNARNNQLTHVEFFHENLESDLDKQMWLKETFTKIILDPARAGALEVMPRLVELSPALIVYVSCNPATLARDCELLLEQGYKLTDIAMIDMFPNTNHLESMVLLTKQ